MHAAVAHPAAFGHWQLQGNTLVCRLPRRTVTVQAPAGLLRQVLALCDGQLAWKAVAQELARSWSTPHVERFLGHLTGEGVLVDAADLLPRWMDIGQAPGVFAPAASRDEWPSLPHAAQSRLLPGQAAMPLPAGAQGFASLLRQRQSIRTFGDEPLAADALRAILWAAGGVARPRQDGAAGGHRTIASGGNMHVLRWFVVVLRDLPGAVGDPLPPGLYDVAFHLEGGCTFTRCQASSPSAWQVLRDPRILRFASALVLPVAQTDCSARKYGNRAAIYAHVEAGEALQNAQLMAAAVSAAGCVRGDAMAQAVLDLLRPFLAGFEGGQWLPMPAYVVGGPPSQRQQAQQRGDDWVQLTPAERLAHRDGFAYSAGPVTEGETTVFTLGRAEDPALAATKAEAEAWERLGWLRLTPTAEARRSELPHAVDPSNLVCYSPRQLGTPGFPFHGFDARRRYLWCDGVDVISGRAVSVPADCVHPVSALTAPHRARALTNSSTSGVAAWTDAGTALEKATLELVERDAFVRAWLARSPLARTRSASLPDAARHRIDLLQAQGYRVEVLRLPSPWAPVYAVFIQHAGRHFTGMTAAAHFDREQALDKALDEAEGRAAQGAAFGPERVARAADVRTPRDIHHYWQMPRFFRQADFLVAGPLLEPFTAPHQACLRWSDLQARCARARRPLIALDITPTGAAVHQGRKPLHVVRALLPGLLPIWFTHGHEPAGLPVYRQAAGARAARPAPLHPFS